MNCDKAMQELVGLLADNEQRPQSQDLQAHLSSCPRCREEVQNMETLWTNLGRLAAPTMPKDASERVLQQIQHVHSSRVRFAPRTWYRRVGLAAMILVSIAAGAMASRSRVALAMFPVTDPDPVQTPVSTDGGGGLFLFLLHRPDGVLPGGRAQRYEQWANELRGANQLVRAGALHTTQGWMLTRDESVIDATPIDGASGEIEGFFLISAPDSAAVVNAARISPHFDYGGLIEVRRVVN